jgi:CheY-like chemotaxis protein
MALVLVVDDHDDTRYVVQKPLGQWGHRTLGANTGEIGLAILATEIPNLIIVDGMMPGMNGVEFIGLVRANETTFMIPMILYTAITDSDFTDNALAKGANEVWIKGKVEIARMRERVAYFLSGGHRAA